MNNIVLQTDYTNSWAIVVGINKYSKFSMLSGAVNDATAIADLLRNEFRFPSGHIHTLIDDQATQPAIKQYLELISQQSQRDDRVVIFFAGHGATRRLPNGTNIGYIATVESKCDEWHSLFRIDHLTEYSRLIGAKHILYIFDACFSGLALKRSGASGIISNEIERWVKDCMTHQSRQVLTAGLAEQLVGDLIDDGHSIFTSYLLRALKGDAAGSEGEITASRIMGYVADAVMKDNRSEQTPAYGDLEGSEPGGDLVFRRPDLHYFKVSAEKEGGINTGIYLKPNDTVSIRATGVITYDGGYHYTNAAGLLSTYKGQPLAHPQAMRPMMWPHPDAYQTKGGKLGVIGSLFGWVGDYSENTAFYIGEEANVTVDAEGYLYLAVNDAKGTYGDNKGEFDVSLRLLK